MHLLCPSFYHFLVRKKPGFEEFTFDIKQAEHGVAFPKTEAGHFERRNKSVVYIVMSTSERPSFLSS